MTKTLLRRVPRLPKGIWRPCCGNGAMAQVLEARGHRVVGTDLVAHGYGETGRDFLAETRARSRFDSAEFRVGDGLSIRKTKRITVVGVPGQIKVQWHRDMPLNAKVGAAIVSRSCGKWSICFQIETPDAHGPPLFRAAVGINVRLTSLIATSDGDTVPTPKWVKVASRKQRRLQRALARCKRASKGRLRAKRNLVRHSAHTANQRRDFTQTVPRSGNRSSHIAFEDLNTPDWRAAGSPSPSSMPRGAN